MAKSKKKNPRKIPGAIKTQKTPKIKLSQCMIVKNEERNIERALSWGKDFLYEQIVVDTGSTDNTVEIAEKMGAKVYHFKWIDDFAAAKNYAIEKASGNWIAFLDADEYYTPEDAAKVIPALEMIQKESPKSNAMSNPWLQLNDQGTVFAVHEQDRIFRNIPLMRYSGKIHESFPPVEKTLVSDINIMHTGYAKSSYKETNKADRNEKLIRENLEKDPDNPDMMIYLADTLRVKEDPESMNESLIYYEKAIRSKRNAHPTLKSNAYTVLLNSILRYTSQREKIEELFELALKEFPDLADVCFLKAFYLTRLQKYEEAWEYYLRCEKLLATTHIETSRLFLSHIAAFYRDMSAVAQKLKYDADLIRCITLSLREQKDQEQLLAVFIDKLLSSGGTDEAVITLLGNIYNFNNPRDKLFIARAAKTANAISFAGKIMDMITPEELSR